MYRPNRDDETRPGMGVFLDLVAALERLRAAVAALDRSVRDDRAEAREALSSLADAIAEVEARLSRLADAAEDANRREDARQRAKAQWISRIWGSRPVQIILLALALALAQALGVRLGGLLPGSGPGQEGGSHAAP